eukprot:8060396-Lingulodinium_polyedra.AAC.1
MSASTHSHLWECRGKTGTGLDDCVRNACAAQKKTAGFMDMRAQVEDTNNLDRHAPMREWRH